MEHSFQTPDAATEKTCLHSSFFWKNYQVANCIGCGIILNIYYYDNSELAEDAPCCCHWSPPSLRRSVTRAAGAALWHSTVAVSVLTTCEKRNNYNKELIILNPKYSQYQTGASHLRVFSTLDRNICSR